MKRIISILIVILLIPIVLRGENKDTIYINNKNQLVIERIIYNIPLEDQQIIEYSRLFLVTSSGGDIEQLSVGSNIIARGFYSFSIGARSKLVGVSFRTYILIMIRSKANKSKITIIPEYITTCTNPHNKRDFYLTIPDDEGKYRSSFETGLSRVESQGLYEGTINAINNTIESYTDYIISQKSEGEW